jgi:hypothetical protein
MIKSGSSDAVNAVVNSHRARPRVSVAGEGKGEMNEISQVQGKRISFISEANLDRFSAGQGRSGL